MPHFRGLSKGWCKNTIPFDVEKKTSYLLLIFGPYQQRKMYLGEGGYNMVSTVRSHRRKELFYETERLSGEHFIHGRDLQKLG
jgi:hypothetical protein